jgi:GNAT superfamily N-acetyltransferase
VTIAGLGAVRFYVRIGYRRKGVTKALISAALKVAKRRNAPTLEGYPFDAAVSPDTSSTGYAAYLLARDSK